MKPILVVLGVLSVCTVVAAQDDAAPAPAPTVIDKLPFTCDQPGTYVLERDLACNDSGVHILSNDVVIDLMGHTITYGTGVKLNEKAVTYNSLQSGNVGHHAIYVTSDPRASKDAPKAGWNYRFTGVVIRNGRIRHGDGEGLAYSDAINVSGTVGCEIRDLTLEVSAPDSSAIIGGRSSKIHDCTVRHTGTHVSNRHAQLAVIVSGTDAEIYNCTLLGGPQAGIKALSGAEIHHNDIRQNATATNCYGVQGYGQRNVHVHHNLIIPTNGRGLHVSEKSVGWRVHDNYIEPRERANREYPKGMQTHGIKMEGCRDAKVWNNVVYVESVPGGSPTPLNFDVPRDAGNEVYDNVFIAKKVTEKEHATALYCVAGDGTGTSVRDNVFFTNDRLFECIWDAPQSYTFTRNRFYRLSPTDKITTYYFWNAKPVSGFRFVDCTFGPGLSTTGYDFPVKNPEDWPADAQYAVAWTTTFQVKSAGVPVKDAKIVVTDVRGKTLTFTTDDRGESAVTLDAFTVKFDAAKREVTREVFTPWAARVTAEGLPAKDVQLPGSASATCIVDMKAGTPVVLPAPPGPVPIPAVCIAAAKARAGPHK
ncbi:MAG TPA: right-handed parallel beta-helix repeat-containing protein [Planctomycetota bacterium]|nr:right-handed parallel beta-helix repeat-containing protein [Planctomycetota bacterium]